MPVLTRSHYIATAVFAYVTFAVLWILLSDQLLLVFVEPARIVELSILKGMLFVLVTASGLALSLYHLPTDHETQHYQLALPGKRRRYWVYPATVLLVGLVLYLRHLLPPDLAQRPMLVILLFPVILAAAIGGFGPGLLATVLVLLVVGWQIRTRYWGTEQVLYLQLQWWFLLLNGLTVSWLSQMLRRTALRYALQQRLLDSIIDSTDDPVFSKDLAGRYQLVNQACGRFLQRTPAQMLGRTDRQLFSPEVASVLEQHDATVKSQQKLLHFQEQMVSSDGQPLHFSVSKGPLLDSNNLLTGTFGIARDITPLLEQQQRLQRVMDGSEQGFWELNLQSDQLSCSERCATMLGSLPAELPASGAQWRALIHPQDLAGWEQALAQHLAGRAGHFTVEYRIRRADQQWHWVQNRGKVVAHDPSGQPSQLAGSVSDIQQRRQTEEALRLAELMFAGSYDAMMLVNADNEIVRVNPGFCRITGYSETEVLGKSPTVLSSGLHDRHFYQQMWQQLLIQGFWRGEIINKRRDGSLYTEMLSISVVRDEHGQVRQYVGIFTDISQIKAHAAELDKVANFDALTGLPNRRLLLTRFNQLLIRALQTSQRCAVCLIDLDDFKAINADFGPAFGDKVLLALSHQLQAVLRHEDTLARLGGDEFVVLLSDMPPLPEGNLIIKRLRKAINTPVLLDGHEISVSASIGVSLYPDDNADPDTLLRHADKAMFAAKERGRNQIQWFDPENEKAAQEHRLMLEELRDALQHQQFVLYYQPKVNLRSGQVLGAEALIRWQHPERGLLAPGQFLPYIEGSELEDKFGRYVLRQACQQAAFWHQQGLALEIGINISASQLLADDFASHLAELLNRWPELPPALIELEILESTAIRDLAAARQALLQCQQLGVRCALDDFGTGYSSLAYLRQLPVHCLKIDQSFVRDMLEDGDDRNIVSGVVQLAQVFSRQVIAEGVESMAHASALLTLGCELAQGYGIARPMPAEQLPGWLAQWQSAAPWHQLRE